MITGKHGEALKYYQECLTKVETVLGKTNPNLATSLNNIGTVLQKTGNYE